MATHMVVLLLFCKQRPQFFKILPKFICKKPVEQKARRSFWGKTMSCKQDLGMVNKKPARCRSQRYIQWPVNDGTMGYATFFGSKVMRRARQLGAVAAVALLAACSNQGVVDPARLSELRDNGLDADRAARAEDRLARITGRDNATGALSGPYGDLQADAGAVEIGPLLVAALERNTTIGAAAQDISRADAERLNAILGYLPQVTFEADFSQVAQTVVESDNAVFLEGEAEFPVINYNLLINQPLIDLSRIFGIQIASNARSLAEVNYVAAVRDVSFEVFDSYVVALQADRQAAFLERRGNLINSQIAGRTTLQDLGLSDSIESGSLRGERASIAAQEANELARSVDALGRLSSLTGTAVTDVAPSVLPSDVAGAESRISVEEAVTEGLENNPTIAAAALRAVDGELTRRQALAADFAPVLSAFAALEFEDREASRFGGGSVTEDTTVGVSLRVPIFNASGSGYAFRPAGEVGRSLVLEYHSARRQLEAEIAATHARMVQLNSAVVSSRQATSAARQVLAAERELVLAGESLELGVIGRQLRLSLAESQQDFYELEYLRAWARLQYLMGVDLAQLAL